MYSLKGDIFQLAEDVFCMYKVIGSNPIISNFIFMRKQLKNNRKQRHIFKINEEKHLILKSITQNLKLSNKIRWKIQTKFFDFPRKGFVTRIKNICILTGRSRSVYRFFKLSRLQIRKWVSYGYCPGVTKHSW